MKDAIKMPPMVIVATPPAAAPADRRGVTISDSPMVVINKDNSASITLTSGDTYNVSLTKDGSQVAVTKGNPPVAVKGADLDKIKDALIQTLRSTENSTFESMAAEAPATKNNQTLNNTENANTIARLDRMADLLGTPREAVMDYARDTARDLLVRIDHPYSPVDANIKFASPPKTN